MSISDDFTDNARHASTIARRIRRSAVAIVGITIALELVASGFHIEAASDRNDHTGVITAVVFAVLWLAVFTGVLIVALKIAAWYDADAAILRSDAIRAADLEADLADETTQPHATEAEEL